MPQQLIESGNKLLDEKRIYIRRTSKIRINVLRFYFGEKSK